MTHRRTVVLVSQALLGLLASLMACSGGSQPGVTTPLEPAPVPVAAPPDGDERVRWSSLRVELDALICVWTYVSEAGDSIDLPWYGERAPCGLPPAQTPIERAVEAAFKDAKDALISLKAESNAAREAIKISDPEARLRAVREAYLSAAFLDVLLRRLPAALQAQELRCDDCPAPAPPVRRELSWSGFEPYLAAHVWPDPVITPRDAKGRPSGPPPISAHICAGLNGLSQLVDPEAALVRAGFLAAFHTDAVAERTSEVLKALLEEPEYLALTTDEARTLHLQSHLAPRLLEEPRVAAGVCATLSRFEPDTGVVVSDCPR